MRTDRPSQRALLFPLLIGTALPALAQDAASAAPDNAPLFPVDNGLIYALVVLAVVQVILIVSLSSIMRTLGGPDGWAKALAKKAGRAAVIIPLLLRSGHADAQAYKGDGDTLAAHELFWWLAGVNLFLFIVLLVQINLVRGLTRLVIGEAPEPVIVVPQGPTWSERILRRLTRQVAIEKEEDILLDHDYDGIRELDNVLPPWWVWLFYGSIVWGVIYLVNMHVTHTLPDQRTEYVEEMEKAKADMAVFLAMQKDRVDERNVEQTMDAGTLALGATIFKQNCVTCHGAAAGGGAGPNLTDVYWLHGGGITNVFTTIKYGVQGKAMKSWKEDLKPSEMQAVANYVLSLGGSMPADAKEPEGEPWQAPATAGDSTVIKSDSTAVLMDTTRTAAR